MSSRSGKTAKLAVDYEPAVPRCILCKHFTQSKTVLMTNSRTARVKQSCAVNPFIPNNNGICKLWVDAVTGETLAK